ncbi:MAG: response regulator [Terracidiphilus sp.]
MKHGESVQSRILVVDDNQVIALTLGAILEEAGYEVASAFSGEEAIERAEAFLPKLLLSDISMRPMNGIEAAVQITAKLPDCRVLFLSGNPSIADCSEAPPPERLVYSFLSKPTPVPDLLSAIACMLPARDAPGEEAGLEIEPGYRKMARPDSRRTARPAWPHLTPASEIACDVSGKTAPPPSVFADGKAGFRPCNPLVAQG